MYLIAEFIMDPELKRSVNNGDLEALKELIRKGVDLDPDMGPKDDLFLLEMAIKKGNTEILKLLLKNGAKLFSHLMYDELAMLKCDNRKDIIDVVHNYWTGDFSEFIELSCQCGDKEMFQIYLGFEDDVQKTFASKRLLRFAVMGGNTEMVKLFLCKSDLHGSIDENGQTILHCAADHHDSPDEFDLPDKEKVTMLLIDRGADVLKGREITAENFMDVRHLSVLEESFAKGTGEATRILLEHGAYFNVNKRGLGILESLKKYGEVHDWKEDPALVLIEFIAKMRLDSSTAVSDENLKSINSSRKLRNHLAMCEAELRRMDSAMLSDCNKTFLHFLMIKDQNKLAAITRNEIVVGKLKSVECRDNFPIYSSLLKYQLRRGLWRNLLLNKVKRFFHAVASAEGNEGLPMLPQICVEHIFSFFDSNDFKGLIAVCDPTNPFDLDICDLAID